MYEGGIPVPGMARSPGQIKPYSSSAGRVSANINFSVRSSSFLAACSSRTFCTMAVNW